MHAAIVNRDPERAKCCPICGRPIRFGGARAICLACHLKAGLEDPDDQPVPATDLVSPSPGDTPRFFGDYELVRELGRGGMGIVHEARQFGTRRSVALKRLATGALASREAVHRFHTEAQAAALLEHPNIVPIYEVGLHDGQYFLAMRYLAGRTLADLAHDGVLPPRRAAEIVWTIALAVHHAHTRGVLHRDLKPGNILLDEAGEPYVSDFGLARITVVDERFTLSTSLLGTAAYLPPEQIRGGPNAGTMAGDIYGLGAILHELLTRQPPFTGSSVADILHKVQEEHPVLLRSENRGQRSEASPLISCSASNFDVKRS
jgi:eukaryotic-like serine/threonine-protein kinase